MLWNLGEHVLDRLQLADPLDPPLPGFLAAHLQGRRRHGKRVGSAFQLGASPPGVGSDGPVPVRRGQPVEAILVV